MLLEALFICRVLELSSAPRTKPSDLGLTLAGSRQHLGLSDDRAGRGSER